MVLKYPPMSPQEMVQEALEVQVVREAAHREALAPQAEKQAQPEVKVEAQPVQEKVLQGLVQGLILISVIGLYRATVQGEGLEAGREVVKPPVPQEAQQEPASTPETFRLAHLKTLLTAQSIGTWPPYGEGLRWNLQMEVAKTTKSKKWGNLFLIIPLKRMNITTSWK